MNKNNIHIQKARVEDYEALRKIFFLTRKELFYWMNKDSIDIYDFDRSTEGELILTATINKEIVGFISIWEEDNFVHNLFVLPEYKRCGIGKILIEECIKIQGLPLTLKCVKENNNAKKFYLSQGWTIEEEVEGKEPYYLMKLY